MELLIVEDNKPTLHQYELNIIKFGHTVHTAKNGIEAWEKLETIPVDMIISDWMMPEMDGLELCQKIRNTNFDHYIYFIIISSENNKKNIATAINSGADDYIIKPVDFEELRARINIGYRIISLEKNIKDEYETIRKNYFQTIRTFVNLLEVYNEDLGGHARRVGKLALKLAQAHPDVPEEDYELVETAGLLHDIGTIGLPNEILYKKRTELNSYEKEQYLSHPVRGEIIFSEIEAMQSIAKLIRSHHEQYNGRGFPDGLAGNDIPLLSQIISAASIYDNLVHKGKIPLEEITAKLHTMRGYQLAPSMVDQLFILNADIIQQENEKKYLEISIDELKDGMILANDVRMKTGAIIIPAETKLSKYNIEKLQNYRSKGHFDQYVFILKKR